MSSTTKLITTGDGSHSLFVQEINESYHSVFGAITESKHVFIRNGPVLWSSGNLTVFEVGFGTGLNALLTAITGIDRGIRITYYSLEKYPLEQQMTDQLNYPSLLSPDGKQTHDLFRAIHQVPWDQSAELNSCFKLHKIRGDLASFIPSFCYDVLYFDAFSPEKQPEMWTGDIMHRLILNLNPEGVFITYCAKGAVRRLLKENGLLVEKLPGPPGKREILRGRKMTGDALLRCASAGKGDG
jgi:tRNA U34 5-methylaminomethyl-2-thiouridine-forming methyltransferase MnmC